MEMKLEVVALPVADVGRAKAFYSERVGFTLDHDVRPNDSMRVVQMTPPGSACSVVIGAGLPLVEPGSVNGVPLLVEDLDAASEELSARGVPISDVQQLGPEGARGSRLASLSSPGRSTLGVQE